MKEWWRPGRYPEVQVKAHRRDRYLSRNPNPEEDVIVLVREQDGNSVPDFNSKSQAASFGRASHANGTIGYADEAATRDHSHERFEIEGSNHQAAHSLDGARANMAEEYFSRRRRAEGGIRHHVAGSHFFRPAQEYSQHAQAE